MKGGENMSKCKQNGNKVSSAAKTLASKSSTKSKKSKAGKTLADHKHKYH